MAPIFVKAFRNFYCAGREEKVPVAFSETFFLPPSLSNHGKPPGTSCAKKKSQLHPKFASPNKVKLRKLCPFFSTG